MERWTGRKEGSSSFGGQLENVLRAKLDVPFVRSLCGQPTIVSEANNWGVGRLEAVS